MLLECQKFLLLVKKWLEHARKGHFLVERSIAQSHRRLTGEHLKHFEVRRRQKIRIAALESENSHAAFFVGKGDKMAGSHSALREILAKLGASLFAIRVDLLFVLGNQQRLFQHRSPSQDIAKAVILRIVVVELGGSGNRLEMNPAPLVQGDTGAFVRNYGCRAVDDGLQYAIEVQSRSNLAAGLG